MTPIEKKFKQDNQLLKIFPEGAIGRKIINIELHII